MQVITTPWGKIHTVGFSACKDDYADIVLFHAGGGLTVKLQSPAMESFRTCCRKLGQPISLTGSWRSCALQTEYHNDDPSRYADPNTSLHPEALAIDVSTTFPRFDEASHLLLAHGWHRARADEPWHHSFWLNA